MDAKADTTVKGSVASTLGERFLEADIDSTSTFRTKKVIDLDRGPCGLIVRWRRCISVFFVSCPQPWQYNGVRSAQRTGYSVIIYSVGRLIHGIMLTRVRSTPLILRAPCLDPAHRREEILQTTHLVAGIDSENRLSTEQRRLTSSVLVQFRGLLECR